MCMNGGDHFGVNQCGGERNTGIHRVARRPGGAALEGKRRRQETFPDLKITGRGCAFKAAEFIQARRAAGLREDALKPHQFVLKTQSARCHQVLENTALTVNLRRNNAARYTKGESSLEGSSVLTQAGLAVMISGRLKSAEVLPQRAQKADGNPTLQQCSECGGGDLDALMDDQPVEVAQGNLAQQFIPTGLVIAPGDLQPLGAKADAALRLGDAGGGHRRARADRVPKSATIMRRFCTLRRRRTSADVAKLCGFGLSPMLRNR